MRPQGTARGARRGCLCFSALLHSRAAHVGISSPPGSHSTTVTLIGAQADSEGALGARCFSSPLHGPKLPFPYAVKRQEMGPRQAF